MWTRLSILLLWIFTHVLRCFPTRCYKGILDSHQSRASMSVATSMALFILELAGLYGVPVVAFSLKHRRIYNKYTISKMLRRYGWIVLAYQMFPGAQHIIVFCAVIRAGFSCELVEHLALDIKIVFRELHKFFPKLRPTLRGRGT